MTQQIPLEAIPNQQFNIVLDDQNCTFRVYQRGNNLYLDLDANKTEIVRGAFCGTNMNIIVNSTPDFIGLLFFTDLSGLNHDPNYEEIGDRFILCFAPEDEL